MNEAYDFLKAAGTYFLATTENGEPRVRPFGTIDIWDGKLTIQTGLKKDVAKQMLANPRVEISAFVPAEGNGSASLRTRPSSTISAPRSTCSTRILL